MNYGTMICKDCGMIFERTGSRQERCPSCAEIRNKRLQRERDKNRDRRERKSGRGKKKLVLRKMEAPEGQAGTGCTRWRTCRYGAERALGGVCNYNFLTGRSKVIVKDGVRTVASTKDCVFYEPREKEKKRTQKPHTIRRGKGTAVIQMDLEGNVLREFESMNAAAKAVGLSNTGGISAACAGRQPTAAGFRWKVKGK